MDQVRYAALDAHCLVGIFEEMLIERGGKLANSGQFLVQPDTSCSYVLFLYSVVLEIFFSGLNGSCGLFMAGSIVDPGPRFLAALLSP